MPATEILYDGSNDPIVPNKLVLINNANKEHVHNYTYNISAYIVTDSLVIFEYLYNKRVAIYSKKKNKMIHELHPYISNDIKPFHGYTIVTYGSNTIIIRSLKDHDSSYIQHYEDYTRRSWAVIEGHNDNIQIIIYKAFAYFRMTYNTKKIRYPKVIGRKITAKPMKITDGFWDISFC